MEVPEYILKKLDTLEGRIRILEGAVVSEVEKEIVTEVESIYITDHDLDRLLKDEGYRLAIAISLSKTRKETFERMGIGERKGYRLIKRSGIDFTTIKKVDRWELKK